MKKTPNPAASKENPNNPSDPQLLARIIEGLDVLRLPPRCAARNDRRTRNRDLANHHPQTRNSGWYIRPPTLVHFVAAFDT